MNKRDNIHHLFRVHLLHMEHHLSLAGSLAGLLHRLHLHHQPRWQVVDIVIVIIVTIVILSSFCHSSHFAKRSPTYLHRAYLSPPVATPAVMATFSVNMVRCSNVMEDRYLAKIL